MISPPSSAMAGDSRIAFTARFCVTDFMRIRLSVFRFLFGVGLSVAVLGFSFGMLRAEDDRPNIVFILADDLGYGDLGCFGQETLATPNLDRMAAEGLKLTRHYSGSTVCAPSRCVLMTGLHTGHCTVRGNGPALLKAEDVTVAEVLQAAGYATGCFGKWGIGNPPPRDDPNRQGFDEFYGYVNMFHAHNFYPPFLIRNGELERLENVTKDEWLIDGREEGGPKEGAGVAKVKKQYAPDLITDEALKFIERNKGGPFFLYHALNVPHANNEGGSDKEQQDGMEVPDYGEFASKDWPNPEKGFAAMIHNIDRDVGRVLDKLQELGLAEKTLVIFSSDNGPHQEGKHEMEFFNSNGELRGMKRDLYEGGVRVPTIAWWPGTIEGGRSSDRLSGFQDFLPTAAELAKADAPEGLDGLSLAGMLTGESEGESHDFLYWEFQEKGGREAVVTTRWKAVRLNTNKDPNGPLELYDLKADPSETTNVADQFPEVIEAMEARLRESHTPQS